MMFAIFFCIVIGHVFGELQGIEIGKEDLKAREDAREDLSPYVKEAINRDQYLQSKDAQLSAQSGNSNETEIDEKPSSLVIRSPVTSGEYEVKKSGQKKVYSETRVADIQSLLKHSDRNISAKKDSIKFRSFPVKSAAARHSGKDFAIKKRRSFRGKRSGASDEFERMMEPAFGLLQPNTQPKKISVRSLAQKAQKNTSYTEKEEKLVDIETSREQGAEPPTFTHSVSPRISAASYSAFQYLLNKLPKVLKSKIIITDDAEIVVLENYVESHSVPAKTLDIYNSAKKKERELLKRLLKDIPIILPIYKSIRKGVAWNYTRLHDKLRQFFQKPSTALEQYEALKRDELASLDSFLTGSNQVGAPEGAKSTEAKSARNKQMQETHGTRAKDPGKQKVVRKTKTKVAAKQNLQVTEASVEDVEELKPEIKQTAEIDEDQNPAKYPKAEEAEQQTLKEATLKEASLPKAARKVKADETEKKNIDAIKIAAAEDAVEQKAAGKVEGEDTETQNLEEDDIAAAEKEEEQKAENKTKAEEAERQKLEGEQLEAAAIAEEQKAEGKAKAKKAEKQAEKEKVKAEDAEKQNLEEQKMGLDEEDEEQNAENKVKVDEAERQKLEESEGAAAEEAEEQKAEGKAKAKEAELRKHRDANATAAKDVKQVQKTQDIATPEAAKKLGKQTAVKPGIAEERKAEELERHENGTTAKERLEPYCGPLKVELSDVEKQEILKAHNDARRKERARNMLQLVWDNELAIIAQYKANTCGYFHSMHKDCSQRHVGQNLFTNFMISDKAAYPPINYTHIIVTWANERVDWNWTTSSCLKGMICTHWMAVTGAKARRLGCGKSECPTLNVHGKWHKMANLIVCNYGPFSMDFERGRRCSHCSKSTADLDEKGFTCENDLCVPCDLKKQPNCTCGRAYSCHNDGQYSTEFCGCICPREYYGTYCERPCGCVDLNPKLCEQWAAHCKDENQKYWLPETCQKTCNTCSLYKRPDTCNPK